jgi:hypothetical protein
MTRVASMSLSRFGQGVEIRVGGVDAHLLPDGAVWVPAQSTLIVADLHLGKGLAFASRGQMVPPYDGHETLAKLRALVAEIRPQRLVLLGDSIHRQGLMVESLDLVAADLLLLAQQTELVWVTGNHDPALAGLHGCVTGEIELPSGLRLRHEPVADGNAEIIGHFHPAARLPTRAGRQRRRCFVASDRRLLLPAFGALTGTLCVSDPAIRNLFPVRESRIFMMIGEGLAQVPFAAVAG